mmetsp:Transcript_14542/g.43714  ORF Transcript_14542/g.43714 Transcript_14542/m.43714 type:complete len:231 (-) Transcript_14542:209-901(-)
MRRSCAAAGGMCSRARSGSSSQSGQSAGVPSAWKMHFSWSVGSLPMNSGVRRRISPKMQPALHMSTACAYSRAPSSSSGGRYQTVITCAVMSCGEPWNRAKPKSVIFTKPRSLMSRFAGLRSRCRMKLAWQCSRPRSRCWKMVLVSSGAKNLDLSRSSDSKFVTQNSKTRFSILLSAPRNTSRRSTTLACRSSRRIFTSRSAVKFAPGISSLYLISLMATTSSLRLSRAL